MDDDSFLEFGQFAVAAQRSRRDYEELQDKTNADGIITGFCSVNSELVGQKTLKLLQLFMIILFWLEHKVLFIMARSYLRSSQKVSPPNCNFY